jgi:hypothetical protein
MRFRVSYFVDSMVRIKDTGAPPQRLGVYSTSDEAYAASRRSIDDFLVREYRPGMTAQFLFRRYRERGAVPFIFGDANAPSNLPSFNPIKYALERCAEICGHSVRYL